MLLSTLAGRLGVECRTDTDRWLTGIAHPRVAQSDELSFLPPEIATYTGDAGVLLVAGPCRHPPSTFALEVPDPLFACARAVDWLPVRFEWSQPPAAQVAPTIALDAEVAAGCVLESGAQVGSGTAVGAWTRIGRGARIGAHCRIAERVTIGDGVTLGNRVSIDAGSVVGCDAFVALRGAATWTPFPAFASVVVQDDASVGAHCSIARGVFAHTLIGYRVRLDAQVHVGHDTRIGADTIMAGATTVGGGVVVGRQCVLGGRVAIADGVEIADRVTITAMSLVTKSIVESATHWSGGWPAQRSSAWWRAIARWRRRPR
ncbi:MAG: UDP-3-O-(3-hydroxymyristoyl)glucosamine N-acyltransferase [Gammaproteobacteria bacterium]